MLSGIQWTWLSSASHNFLYLHTSRSPHTKILGTTETIRLKSRLHDPHFQMSLPPLKLCPVVQWSSSHKLPASCLTILIPYIFLSISR
jgi:hypothetical protein